MSDKSVLITPTNTGYNLMVGGVENGMPVSYREVTLVTSKSGKRFQVRSDTSYGVHSHTGFVSFETALRTALFLIGLDLKTGTLA